MNKEIDIVCKALEREFGHQQRLGHVRFYPSGYTIEALAKAAVEALAQSKTGLKTAD